MKKILQRLWIFMIFLFLYFPIFILIVYSFTKSTMIGSLRGFSLHNYVTLFTLPELRNMIIGTILLALVVALLSSLLGTLGAIGTFYAKKRVKKGVTLINQIPVVNADVVTGFSICVLVIAFLGISKDTYIPLVAGQTVLCAPFVYLSVMPKLQQMDSHLYEAALDLGCNHRQALFRVVFHEIIPGVLSGFVLAITLSFDDYFIATYTKPAAFDTISTYVVNATKGARTEIKTALWALSALIFFVVVLAVVVMNAKGRRGNREQKG